MEHKTRYVRFLRDTWRNLSAADETLPEYSFHQCLELRKWMRERTKKEAPELHDLKHAIAKQAGTKRLMQNSAVLRTGQTSTGRFSAATPNMQNSGYGPWHYTPDPMRDTSLVLEGIRAVHNPLLMLAKVAAEADKKQKKQDKRKKNKKRRH